MVVKWQSFAPSTISTTGLCNLVSWIYLVIVVDMQAFVQPEIITHQCIQSIRRRNPTKRILLSTFLNVWSTTANTLHKYTQTTITTTRLPSVTAIAYAIFVLLECVYFFWILIVLRSNQIQRSHPRMQQRTLLAWCACKCTQKRGDHNIHTGRHDGSPRSTAPPFYLATVNKFKRLGIVIIIFFDPLNRCCITSE